MPAHLQQIAYAGTELADLAQRLELSAPFAIWESTAASLTATSGKRHTTSRFAYLFPEFSDICTLSNNCLEISHRGALIARHEIDSNTFDPIAELHTQLPFLANPCIDSSLPLAYSIGAVGFLGYDLARFFEQLPALSSLPNEPELFCAKPAVALVLDRAQQQLTIVAPYPADDNRARLDAGERCSVWNAQVNDALAKHQKDVEREDTCFHNACDYDETPSSFSAQAFSSVEFQHLVSRAQEYIRAGDAFQIVLSNSFNSETNANSIAIYDYLRKHNPSPYHFLFSLNGWQLVGASPEVFLRSTPTRPSANAPVRTTISMRPVAGTYSTDAAHLQTNAITEDQKERAEHLMLVDHARNDIGRVAEIGTVQVADLFSVESYRDVHHLVSTVSGTLASGQTVLEAVRACFPIATLTGTPKIRAMEIIAELEGPARGVHGGCAFMADQQGGFDAGVIIRSAVLQQQRARVQAGAGIVLDSNPEREYNECRWKARAIEQAVTFGRQ